MKTASTGSLLKQLESLPDPRSEKNRKHLLVDVVAIAVCGVLVIAIDGKTLRRSHDKKNALGPLHLVSAWASEAGFSLGQYATDEKSNEKSNEITAIPELLEAVQ